MNHQEKLQQVKKQLKIYSDFSSAIHLTNTSVEASLKLAKEVQRLEHLKRSLENEVIKNLYAHFPEDEAVIPSSINFEK